MTFCVIDVITSFPYLRLSENSVPCAKRGQNDIDEQKFSALNLSDDALHMCTIYNITVGLQVPSI